MSTPDKFFFWKTLAFFTLLIAQFNCLNYSLYASSCTDESTTRVCPQKDNITEYLMSIKKGGTNILSPNDYDKNFFLCE